MDGVWTVSRWLPALCCVSVVMQRCERADIVWCLCESRVDGVQEEGSGLTSGCAWTSRG
jgi:hypothetical protein